MERTADNMYYVQSVHRAIAILRFLSNAKPMTVSELSRQFDIPKTTCFMILQTLEYEGLIEKLEDHKYQISQGIFELVFGNEYLDALRKVGEPVIQKLSEETGMTVHLAIKQGIETVYVLKAQGSGFVQFNTYIGQRHLLHLTSVGKAILMGMQDDRILNLIPRERYTSVTQFTITSPEELLEQIRKFRNIGYAIEDEEGEYGIRCVGAPVIDSKGRTVCGLSVTELKSKMPDECFDEIGRMLIDAAAELAGKLELSGYKLTQQNELKES